MSLLLSKLASSPLGDLLLIPPSQGELHPFPSFVRVQWSPACKPTSSQPPAAAVRWSSPENHLCKQAPVKGDIYVLRTGVVSRQDSHEVSSQDPAFYLHSKGGNPGKGGQLRPALPSVTYTGTGDTTAGNSSHARTCPQSLGWAGEELLCVGRKGREKLGSLLSSPGRADTSQGALASAVKCASVGVLSGANIMAGTVLGTSHGAGPIAGTNRPCSWTTEDEDPGDRTDLAGDGRDRLRGEGPRQG